MNPQGLGLEGHLQHDLLPDLVRVGRCLVFFRASTWVLSVLPMPRAGRGLWVVVKPIRLFDAYLLIALAFLPF